MDTYKRRIEQLKEHMDRKGYGSFLVFKQENIHYLTGFRGKGAASILVVGTKKIHLLVHFIYLFEAKKSVGEGISLTQYRTDKWKALGPLLQDTGLSLGTEESISYRDYKKIKSLAQARAKKLVTEQGLVEELRAVKDQEEIARISGACVVTDQACQWLMEKGAPYFFSKTEAELALALEKKILGLGGEGKSFDMVVANGKNSALPHYVPGSKKMVPGTILIDFGAAYKGYCADMTRTFFVGLKNTGKFKKIYDIVLEAQTRAIAHIKEGIAAKEVDSIARKIIESAGFGKNFGHGLGHGVGLEIHEAPVLGPQSSQTLKAGMVVTVEPGIYVEGLGGVRIEDMVLVTRRGCRILSGTAKKFINMNG